MKKILAGGGLLLILVMANVVAAGVFQVLGPIALEIQDEDLRTCAFGAVCGAAIGSALAFLSGSVRAMVEQLQCRAGRRGG